MPWPSFLERSRHAGRVNPASWSRLANLISLSVSLAMGKPQVINGASIRNGELAADCLLRFTSSGS